MASKKVIVLITGANSGVGFGLASQLMLRGTYHVLLGSRTTEKGNAAVKALKSQHQAHFNAVEFLHIDVTDDETISKAAATVERNHGKVDVIVNNAAITAMDSPFRQQMRDCFDTNATGPIAVVRAFTPLLRKSTMTSPSPRIVNITSGAGSIGRCLDPTSPMYGMQGFQYRTSKAALNMVTAIQWVEFGPDIKVFAYDPGFTVSNLGPHNKAEHGARSAEDSAKPLVDVLEGKRDDEAGLLIHKDGQYPW
jgi:NAD(P)-dependent dehydrogenase (short-subunit alcohol dehydrogenase family)